MVAPSLRPASWGPGSWGPRRSPAVTTGYLELKRRLVRAALWRLWRLPESRDRELRAGGASCSIDFLCPPVALLTAAVRSCGTVSCLLQSPAPRGAVPLVACRSKMETTRSGSKAVLAGHCLCGVVMGHLRMRSRRASECLRRGLAGQHRITLERRSKRATQATQRAQTYSSRPDRSGTHNKHNGITLQYVSHRHESHRW